MAESRDEIKNVDDKELEPRDNPDLETFGDSLRKRLRRLKTVFYLSVKKDAKSEGEALIYEGLNGQYYMRMNTDGDKMWQKEEVYQLGKISKQEAIDITKGYMSMFWEELDNG